MHRSIRACPGAGGSSMNNVARADRGKPRWPSASFTLRQEQGQHLILGAEKSWPAGTFSPPDPLDQGAADLRPSPLLVGAHAPLASQEAGHARGRQAGGECCKSQGRLAVALRVRTYCSASSSFCGTVESRFEGWIGDHVIAPQIG